MRLRSELSGLSSLCLLAAVVVGCSQRLGCRGTNRGSSFAISDDSVRIGKRADGRAVLEEQADAIGTLKSGIKLFGLPGEILAFQVIARAETEALRKVRVEVNFPPESIEPPRIEKFVVRTLTMERRSGGKLKGESLGWRAGAMPEDPSSDGTVAAPLIPVEIAPTSTDYPMTVDQGEQRVVWVDLELPIEARGKKSGVIQIQGEKQNGQRVDAEIPIEIEVGQTPLPYGAIKTMVYFSAKEITDRIGSDDAVIQYQQLMHRHHVTTFTQIKTEGDAQSQVAALSGRIFTKAKGYEGPGEGKASDLVVIGSYGSLGEPNQAKVEEVSRILGQLASNGIEDAPGLVDIFLYAIDEQCDSSRASEWKQALSRATDPRTRKLRVGQTCSVDPSKQAADIVMATAETLTDSLLNAARESKKSLWLYNGNEPATGTFLTDGTFVGIRANGWLQQVYGIDRWFYWESTFWNDDNRGGQGPYDPLSRAETFHNSQGDHANGDGVLVYPGRQIINKAWVDLRFSGVIPSMRLKQWRRGIQDAGYIRLAQEVNAEETIAALHGLIPKLSELSTNGRHPLWSTKGSAYYQARRRLFDIISSGKASH